MGYTMTRCMCHLILSSTSNVYMHLVGAAMSGGQIIMSAILIINTEIYELQHLNSC